MAQSKSFFDDVRNHLECSVCQEQFSEINEPKILKCLHTFCKTCLEAWLRQQREGELSCPTCRQITECPNNIQSLPSNLFCKQLVEIVEAYSGQGQEDSSHCGICDEKKPLKFYCSDCNSFLCDDCVSAHKKGKVFRDHHVKEIGNFETSDVQDYARRANVCKKHEDEMRFYCERCKICICRDCAILEHQDHNKISLDQGLENNRSEIETKMLTVEENGSRLKSYKGTLEKRRLQVNGSIEEATKEVKRVAERCILLIRQHEASVTERLVEQKTAFQDAFDNQMTSLDGKLVEIENTLAFSKEVLLRKNLPEILNVKATIEQRLQELSVPFEAMPKLGYSGVKYVQSDVSFLKDALGKLVTTDTEPSVSVAEGKSLTEGLKGADCTFTVITKNSAGQTTYSEIDEVSVKIISLAKNKETETVVTDLKDGRYSISYRPTTPGDFAVSIEVGGNPITGSPFKLKVKPRSSKYQVKPERRILDDPLTLSCHSPAQAACYSRAMKRIANEKGARSPPRGDEFKADKEDEETCPICLDPILSPRSLKCKHVFCSGCLQTALDVCNKCPVCQQPQGVLQGNQPRGEMRSRTERCNVPGYEGYGAIIIEYRFPSGVQGREHPHPGQYYNGTSRTAYLPDTREGREVLQLLRRAFDARLVFTVGTSITTGIPNQVIWNDIHHKTSVFGGPNGFGYPDPDYLRRVKEELAAKGIR